MEEKMEMIREDVLEEVSGGAGGQKQVQIINCKKSCNVRSTPNSSVKTNIIGTAPLGEKYLFYGWSGSWAKVKYGSGNGYIYKKFIKVL